VSGKIFAQRTAPTAGRTATVAVSVATVWTRPEAVREIDAPAIAEVPDVRRWVASMSKQQLLDLDGRTLTQLLLGEQVLVEEVSGDWTRVIAIEQPAGKLDERGYPGVVRTAHLTGGEPPQGVREVVVDATATALCDEPNGDVLLRGVVIGTRLAVAGERERGWLPVLVPAADGPLWVREADVATAPTGTPSAKDLLAVAERLRDVPYVWGGLSAYGIDCSGLVHLAHRRLGVTVPRDADDQSVVGEQIELGHEQPGDLYFFARPGKSPHHVGLAAGPDRQMLHASGQESAGKVVNEPMTEDRSATLVAARRTLT
jgi:cell wall-associated NlpC family hydrolase